MCLSSGVDGGQKCSAVQERVISRGPSRRRRREGVV